VAPRWFAFFVLVGVAGCAAPAVVQNPRVAIRPRAGASDSALVVIHPATVCGFTIRAESRSLVDRDATFGEDVPIDITRRVPDGAWEVLPGGSVATVFTAVAMPPGRYTLVGQASSDDWELLSRRSGDGARLARTNCDGKLEPRPLRLAFRVETGQVTLLSLPRGAVGFEELRKLGSAADDPYVMVAAGSWFPQVRRARERTRRALSARQRQPRDGYDVYPSCDGMTSVVRTTGAAVSWDASLETVVGERRFRPPVLTRSLHATGFGRGCVRRYAFVLLISDPKELDAAVEAAGAWLVAGDHAGEIAILVSAVPVPL
jgi:hypothetical protein